MGKLSANELRAAYERYVSGVGTVAYSWNRLVETLSQVFVEVTKMDENVAKAVWYSIDNDRLQIKILQAAIDTAPEDQWLPRLPTAREDLRWLAERAFNLVDARNNAIHAPCLARVEESGAVVVSDQYSGHQRAKKLVGVPLEDEFAFVADRADRLSRYADIAIIGLRHEHSTWPNRPALPERKHQRDRTI